jgi:protein-tyrosine phosphatase
LITSPTRSSSATRTTRAITTPSAPRASPSSSLTHDSPATPAPPRGDRVVDHPSVDGPRNDVDTFATAADALRSLCADDERVLVHGSAGTSRRVAIDPGEDAREPST